MNSHAEIEAARIRMKQRMNYAFRRNELLAEWDIPDQWGWLFGDASTHTFCKRIESEQELRSLISSVCPRIKNGYTCIHLEPAVELLNKGWGAAVFDIYATEERPAKIGPHWHRFNERIMFLTGHGVLNIAGMDYAVEAQTLWDVPAGEIHSGTAYADSRAISFFRTRDGKPNYMGPVEDNGTITEA